MRKKRIKAESLIGQTFNSWTVLGLSIKPKGMINNYCLCRCKCGVEKSVKATNLPNGKSRSCGKKGCRSWNGDRKSAYKDLPGAVLCAIRRCAAVRGIAYLVSPAVLHRQLVAQNYQCAYTGSKLVFGKSVSDTNASLDRIDSNKPYTKKNVQWVLKNINLMKRQFSHEEFVSICRTIANRFP